MDPASFIFVAHMMCAGSVTMPRTCKVQMECLRTSADGVENVPVSFCEKAMAPKPFVPQVPDNEAPQPPPPEEFDKVPPKPEKFDG